MTHGIVKGYAFPAERPAAALSRTPGVVGLSVASSGTWRTERHGSLRRPEMSWRSRRKSRSSSSWPEKLWAPAASGGAGDAILIEVEFEDFLEGAWNDGAEASGSPRSAADLTFTFEERLRWVHELAEFRCEVPGVLEVTIDLARARVDARIAASLLSYLPPF